MKKRIVIAFLICTLLSFSFGGMAAGTTAQDAIDARIASGEYPTVTMAFGSFTGPSAGANRVNRLISEYTQKTLGIAVDIINVNFANYAQQLQLMFTSGEPLDLYCAVGVMGIGLSNSVNNGYACDLEENDLLATYGQGIIDAAGMESINTSRVDGVLYGIPQMKEHANGVAGIIIGKEYLDAIGYDYQAAFEAQGDDVLMASETIYTDWDTVEDLFARLHEAYPDQYVFGPQKYETHIVPVDDVGGDLFGVLFADSTELKLENFFDSQQFYDYCQRVYRWNQAGYISRDALTDTIDINSKVASGEILAFLSNIKPGQSKAYQLDSVIFQVGPYFSRSNNISDMPWCMSSTTRDPIAAMQVLNAFFSDPVLSNLLVWGEEGVDYVMNDDGRIAYPEGLDATTVDYMLGVSWEIPNQFITYLFENQDIHLWEQYSRMNDEAIKSLASGFIFDNTSVSNEFVSLQNVWAEYQDQLMLGFVDPDVAIPELVNKLNAAGLERYVAEKQAQLDAWAASK